jgi:hypothetical protein
LKDERLVQSVRLICDSSFAGQYKAERLVLLETLIEVKPAEWQLIEVRFAQLLASIEPPQLLEKSIEVLKDVRAALSEINKFETPSEVIVPAGSSV